MLETEPPSSTTTLILTKPDTPALLASSCWDIPARMIAATEHPYIDVIGHPTGRKIERRRPYALDVPALIEAAVRTHTMLEINSSPRSSTSVDNRRS